MKTETTTTRVAAQREGKDTNYLSDYQIVFNEFSYGTLTMMQVTVKTGIPTQYICRYVGMMHDDGLIQIHHFGKCPITGSNGVQFLTTDTSLFKSSIQQLNLFDDEQI